MIGSLGEREKLWKHEAFASVSTGVWSTPKLSRVLQYKINFTEVRK